MSEAKQADPVKIDGSKIPDKQSPDGGGTTGQVTIKDGAAGQATTKGGATGQTTTKGGATGQATTKDGTTGQATTKDGTTGQTTTKGGATGQATTNGGAAVTVTAEEVERRTTRDQGLEDDEARFAREMAEVMKLSEASAMEEERNREWNELREKSKEYSAYSFNVEEEVQAQVDERTIYDRAVEMSEKIGDGTPMIYKLKGREIGGNKKRRVRRLAYGPHNDDMRERTILVVGETGSGKSALIDSLANYIMGGKQADDKARFRIVDVQEDEIKSNTAESQTDWITCYTINKIKDGPVNFNLNLIDTPGFGDTRGIKRDKEIVDQIQDLFETMDEYGILCLDTVCLVIKTTTTRLTATQKYIFESLMNLFGKDLGGNIIMLGTFSDGSRPQALGCMEKGEIPYKENFNFNNCALGDPKSGLNKMYWDMMMESWKAFFDTLQTMQSKSLKLTVDVLIEREFLQDCVSMLMQQVNVGLNKMNNLRTMTKASETGSSGQQIKYQKCGWKKVESRSTKTNCSTCQQTCVQREVSMRPEEKCKICKCCNPHQVEKFIWESVVEEKSMTIQELQAEYKVQNAKQLEEILTEEYKQVKDKVDDNIMRMRESNAKLLEIALRPKRQSVVEYVKLMIEAEKLDAKAGWVDRVSELEVLRNSYSTVDKYLDPNFKWSEKKD